MNSPERSINPHISVDCVIFGFLRNRLMVLLIEREVSDHTGRKSCDMKLPGDFISTREDLDQAAIRTLYELTGLQDIYLRQFAVFGRPDRIAEKVDMEWLRETTGMEIQRVVTTAYYALINISETNPRLASHHNARWVDVNRIPKLAFDHARIISRGLLHLQDALRSEPIGFELLPEKFTIRELQTLYEVILNCRLDNRNFRKKVLKARHLVQLPEKQVGVAHKPAYFYRFDRERYEQNRTESLGFNF